MDNLEAAWTFVPGMTKQAAPSAWVAKSYLDEKGGTLILYTEFLFDEMPFVWEEFSRVWAPVLEKKLGVGAHRDAPATDGEAHKGVAHETHEGEVP